MDAFAALADPVRRDLLMSLTRGSARVVDLAEQFPISRPAVSRHLRLLTDAGLTSVADRGRERHYALAPAGLDPVRGLLDRLASGPPAPPIAATALDALELEVRRVGRDRRPIARTRQEDTA